MALAFAALASGCAGAPSQDSAQAESQLDQHDPLEGANRAALNFNLKVDRFVLKPAAQAYAKLPQPARHGVDNFFSNLWLPNTIINDVLQGKFGHAGRDAGRFVINSVIGFLGLMDPASEMGFPRRREDFGQTLAVWGVPPGPYLMLPFLGPSNLRDTAGLAPQFAYTDPLLALDSPQSSVASAARLVDARERRLGLDEVLELQPDKYLFLREGYRQARNLAIHDGNRPDGLDGASEGELQDALLQDEESD